MRDLWPTLLKSYIGKEFIVHLKGQSKQISGTLNQIMNGIIHYSPTDSNFTDGFIFIPEISHIEFKLATSNTSTPTKTESELKNSSINDYLV